MINANELMIGNWAFSKTYQKPIQFTSFFGLCNVEANPELFEPIKLTEEWLLKFGFKKSYNVFLINIEGFSYLTANAYECNGNFGYCMRDEYEDYLEVKYVHQLQNITYALTGQDLQLTNSN